MRVKILATAAVTVSLVAAALVSVSCRGGLEEPSSTRLPETVDEEVLIVQGDVYDWNGSLLPGATVTWECYDCGVLCGTTETRPNGHYEIWRDDDFGEHQGHTLRGEAFHPAAPCAGPVRWIYDYDPALIPYWVDFYW